MKLMLILLHKQNLHLIQYNVCEKYADRINAEIVYISMMQTSFIPAI